MWTNSIRNLHILNDGYRYSLTDQSEQAEQPKQIKIHLRPHQKAVLYEMEQRELALQDGLDTSGEKLFCRFAMLGDGVGIGKSLMVLGHIARLKNYDGITHWKELTDHCSNMLYSIKDQTYSDVSNAGCLIVVPHTLYKQWEQYITQQTTLSFFGVKTKKFLEQEKWKTAKMTEKDVVLVSNTLYGTLQTEMSRQKVVWKRVFFDEADTIHIPSTQPIPDTKFTWLISASWPNLILSNMNVYFTYHQYSTYIQENNRHLDNQLIQVTNAWRQRGDHAGYFYLNQHFRIVSQSFLRPYLVSGHKLRGRTVVRCRDEFIQNSIAMPPLYMRNILCRPSVAQRIVANAISADVRQLLHAGDYAGALQAVGANFQDSKSIIQAVTDNRLKEIDRLQKTLEFKSSIEYASPQQKENALKHLRTKIEGLQEQVKSIRERIENYKEEICPICFEEPQNVTLVPCCHRVFCGGCILTSLTAKENCPLCRAIIHPRQLQSMSETKRQNNATNAANSSPEPLKKVEQLIELLRQGMEANPDARFLIFSRFDNPLNQITQELSAMNIHAAQVQGNKDVIHRILKQFEDGKLRVLLLNSLMAGAGMNITSATHVILLHGMNHEEEKQILGRAYRMGRKDPLQVVRLLHPDEMLDTHH